MKKGWMKRLLSLALAGMMTLPFMVACGDETPDNGGETPGGTQQPGGSTGGSTSDGSGGGSESYTPSTGERTTLKFYFYQAGYGDAWVRESIANFERKYPQYKIEATGNSGMFDELEMKINNNNCDGDIVIIKDTNYRSFASENKLVDLTDMMDMQLPDSSMTVRDILPDAHYEWRSVEGRQYGLPWQENPAAGIIYNKTMLYDELGYTEADLPQTMEEFWQLCDAICYLPQNMDSDDTNDVYPLVYGGGQEFGYVPLTLNQWFLEDVGADYMEDVFLQYETAQNHTDTEDTREKVYSTLAKMLNGTTESTTGTGKNLRYTSLYAKGYQATQAAQAFIRGEAAMYISGSWFPTENKDILNGTNYGDFDYGFFGMPHINADKKDKNGNDSSNLRYSYASNSFAIPATSTNQEAAKLFLLELYSNQNVESFAKHNMGLTRPTTLPTTDLSFDVLTDAREAGFAEQAYKYYKGTSSNPTRTVYSLSRAKMSGNLAPLIYSHPYATGEDTLTSIINAPSLTRALEIVATDVPQETAFVFDTYWDSNANNGEGNWYERYL